jgi:hypothetical protein
MPPLPHSALKWTNGPFEIDDDRARLDLDRVTDWLAASSWA